MKNVPDPAHALTYPCFILMDGPVPWTITTEDGEYCICLFTEKDLVDDFCRSVGGGPIVDVIMVANRKSLIANLKTIENALSEANFACVTVNPVYKQQVITARIGDLIRILQRQS